MYLSFITAQHHLSKLSTCIQKIHFHTADPRLSASQQILIVITFFQPASSVLPTGKHFSPLQKNHNCLPKDPNERKKRKKIKQVSQRPSTKLKELLGCLDEELTFFKGNLSDTNGVPLPSADLPLPIEADTKHTTTQHPTYIKAFLSPAVPFQHYPNDLW